MKIVHFADCQIEARASLLANRFDEMDDSIQSFLELAKAEKPNVIVFAGDLFQYNSPNANELILASRLLTACSDIAPTIVIPGNHDIKQRSNQLIIAGEQKTEYDAVDALIKSIDSENLKYVRHSGHTDFAGIRWWVWSQIDKHTANVSYSPWTDDNLRRLADYPELTNIELFHDPISSYDDFSGFVNGHGVALSDFRCRTVLAGDIHNPGIYKASERTFVYASSLIQRNFGEGDYWQDGRLTKSRNAKHGFYVHTLDHDVIVESRFVELPRTVERHTFELTKDFDYANYATLLTLPKSNVHRLVRLKIASNFDTFRLYYDRIVSRLTEQNCHVIDVVYGNLDVVTELSAYEMTSDALTLDKLTNLSHTYIRKLVDDSGISMTERNKATDRLTKVFDHCLTLVDTSSQIVTLAIEQLTLRNFMTVDEISIDFANNGLYKIGGSNAVGKTTITNGLSWMVTDLISTEQSSANRKQNALEYFNLFNRDRHTVEGSMSFKYNVDRYTLDKTLTRIVDAKTNKVKDVKLTYRLVGGSVDLNDHAEISAFMSSILDVWTFHKFVSVNARKLENLLKVDPIDLQSRLMLMLGLRWIEELKTKTIDQAKALLFDGLIDNGLSNEQVLAAINNDRASIVGYTSQLTDTQEYIELLTISLETLEQSIAKSRDSLSPIDMTIVEINDKVAQHTSMLAKYELALARLETIDKLLIEHGIAETIDSLDVFRRSIENDTLVLAEQRRSMIETESELAVEQSDFLAKQTSIIFELDKQINALRAKVNLTNEANTKNYIRLFDEKTFIERSLTDLTASEAKIKDSFKQSFNMYTVAIAETKAKIETIDQPCDVCHNTVSPERKIVLLKTYSDEITRTNESIDKLKLDSIASLQAMQTLIVAKQEELKAVNAELVDSQQKHKLNLEALESDLANLTSERSSVSLETFVSAKTDSLSKAKDDIAETNARLEACKAEQLRVLAKQSDLYKQLSIAEQSDKQKSILNNDMTALKKLLDDLELTRKRIESNTIIQSKINEEIVLLKQKRNELEQYRKQESNLEYAIVDLKKYILDSQVKLEQIRDWSLAKQLYGIYKKFVAKDGLRSFIFKSLVPWFNHEFSSLLANVPIRLVFDSEGRLYQEDLSISRRTPVIYCSGMETTVLGLALLLMILRNCPRLKTNLLMIDEVTGQLNDGQSIVTYRGLDYLQIFVQFLRKVSKTHAIYLIDHVLSPDKFDKIYELRKDENGSVLSIVD